MILQVNLLAAGCDLYRACRASAPEGCHWHGAAREGLPPIRAKWVTCTELIKPEICWRRQACAKTSSSLDCNPVALIIISPCQAQAGGLSAGGAAEGWQCPVAPVPQDSAGQRQCHGTALGVFCSPDAVQEVIGSAKGRLIFPGDLFLLLFF